MFFILSNKLLACPVRVPVPAEHSSHAVPRSAALYRPSAVLRRAQSSAGRPEDCGVLL